MLHLPHASVPTNFPLSKENPTSTDAGWSNAIFLSPKITGRTGKMIVKIIEKIPAPLQPCFSAFRRLFLERLKAENVARVWGNVFL